MNPCYAWFTAWNDREPMLWHRFAGLEHGTFRAKCGAAVDISAGLRSVMRQPDGDVCEECEPNDQGGD